MATELKKQNAEEDQFLIDSDDEDTLKDRYLLFFLDKEIYGVEIVHVVEIIELQKITEVPDMPNFVRGVINLRGKVIPVIDLRLRFGLSSREYDDRNCIVIIEYDTISVGFIVDTVSEVREILPSSVDPPPSFKTAKNHEKYLLGMGKVETEVKILLDVGKILLENELKELKV